MRRIDRIASVSVVALALVVGGCNKAEGEGEACQHDEKSKHATTEVKHSAVTVKTAPTGEQVAHAGAPFSEAVSVSLTQLLDKPADFVGKKVRVRGNVSAMCTHRRGWFAVVADDKSGRSLRVITAPVFLVPQGSIGKTAEAEGTVELHEMNAKHARHMTKEHKLELPSERRGDKVQTVIIRASAADFT